MNYQQKMNELLSQLPDHTQTLLLHSCCAPCSSYVLDYLREYFNITVFYYNPNITEEAEYLKRIGEQERFVKAMNMKYPTGNRIGFLAGEYRPEEFFRIAEGFEDAPEGGERCFRCYELRLRATAEMAASHNFDYFATTLTLSPLKNAAKLNEIGNRSGEGKSSVYLESDFKKQDGYLKSIRLSEEFGLYRQNYCGCIFSKRD